MIPRSIVYADQQRVVNGAGLPDWKCVYRFLGDMIEARDQTG